MWWPFSRKKSEQRNLSIDDFLALSGVPNTGSGEYVSAGTAESLPAVMNAVSVIAEAVATMPCYLYLVRNDKGREAREWLDSHPVDILLNEQPNSCQTPYQFKRTMMRHCLLNGNAYAVIEWGQDGQPKSLHPYAPGCVVPERTGAHKYRYTITEPCTGTVRTYLQEEVLHLRYASDDGFLGRSPVTICREALGLGLAQQRHGASIMKDGMMAAGIITSGEWLDGVKGKQALDALERYKGAKNAGKTPILEGGMDYKQLGMSNQDPVLAWSMSNVVMQSDANANIKPNKKKSSNKIDPSVAALMAFGTFQAEHEEFAFDMSDSHKERLAAFDGV